MINDELKTEKSLVKSEAQAVSAEKPAGFVQATRDFFGNALSTVKGKDLIPSHALALSTALCREAFPHIDVDILTALQYLRKETVTLPPDMPKGFVLITYRQHPIGWVKNLGNRTNNLYPMEWKIKSGHLPETLPIVVE